MRLKKLFNKLNRRTVVTVSLIAVVFVMSLGYAALSQYIDIEGLAIIDRSWIIKITEVTSNVTNNGVNNSNTYVGTTVTMNANLPNANSTVTYNITLKNEGNLKAKLHSIEKIEDDNTSITYTVSGIEEGVTTLNPGEENTVAVTIKAKDGVTSLSDTEKSVMLSFNYVENSVDSNGIPTNPETYDEYSIGDKVKLTDGSIWYVVKDSNSTEEYVTLISEENYGTYAFDTSGSTMYDPTKNTNIGYTINNTILPNIKTAIDNGGGNSVGTTGRLLTLSEYNTFITLGKSFGTNETWILTENSDTLVNYYNNELTTKVATEEGALRPVIITLKDNVTMSRPILLSNQIKIDNTDPLTNNEVPSDGVNSTYVNNTTPGINFGAISSDTNGKGLYITSDLTKTEDIDGDGTGEEVYYYRGAVENNFVQFGSYPAGTTVNGVTYEAETPMYWRIVRINEDGSIRLIYNGTTLDATGGDATIGTSLFNENWDANTYVGYMYGLSWSSGNDAYKLVHANDNPSTIKTYIDDWYNNANLTSLSEDYLADAGFCNDRSLFSGSGINFIATYYRTYNRLYNEYHPQFSCPNIDNDLFTTSESSKGNKSLSNPVGLITADEVAYAGGVRQTTNESYYLYTEKDYWTMSPFDFDGHDDLTSMYAARVFYVDSGGISAGGVFNEVFVRPIINLQSTVELSDELPEGCTSLNGTASCPYIIKTN